MGRIHEQVGHLAARPLRLCTPRLAPAHCPLGKLPTLPALARVGANASAARSARRPDGAGHAAGRAGPERPGETAQEPRRPLRRRRRRHLRAECQRASGGRACLCASGAVGRRQGDGPASRAVLRLPHARRRGAGHARRLGTLRPLGRGVGHAAARLPLPRHRRLRRQPGIVPGAYRRGIRPAVQGPRSERPALMEGRAMGPWTRQHPAGGAVLPGAPCPRHARAAAAASECALHDGA
mmetsp:Transcript_29337/g.94604  ORF Transcript_29337/g.94604 Transcript_29337/m.94604 type:complete len:238 (-) Transcript_29337:1437-2150(-)